MPTPASARRHYRFLQYLQTRTITAARRVWQRMEPGANWQKQYDESVGPALFALAVAAQMAAAEEADSYVSDLLNELAFGPPTRSGVLRPRGFAGFMGDGRPVGSLLQLSVVKAGQSFNEAASKAGGTMTNQIPDVFDRPAAAREALETAQSFVDLTFHEIVAETARAAESAATAQREWVGGWVRMLNPPSCSRCTVLAGRFYMWNEGFARHPNCDCLHIPSSESVSGDLVVSPDAYFESLTPRQQDKVFTKAGAQAIRDGADISKVVNARRGMQKAQVFGRDTLVTTEGTARRRNAGRAPIRLMPESIYDQAKDRPDAIRLLKLHGFIH